MKMKYVFCGLLSCLLILPLFGQYTLIDKARMARERGMYDVALKILDDAEQKARLSELGRLWYERGSVLETQYWKGKKSFDHLHSLLGCYKNAYLSGSDDFEKINYKEKLNQWWHFMIKEGKEAYLQGAYSTAEVYFKACRDLEPDRMEAYYYSGMCHFDQEEWEKARQLMQQSLEGEFYQTEAYRVLIYVARFVEHDTRKAVVIASEGLTHLPNDPYLREEMAMMQIHLGEFVKARPHLLWLISQHPENSEYLFNLARSYEESEELYTAEWFYENLLEQEPQNFEAWYNLGVLNYNQASTELNHSETKEGFGHLTKAMYAFEEASKLHPSDPEVMQNLYQIYKCMGFVEKANYLKNKIPKGRVLNQMGGTKK